MANPNPPGVPKTEEQRRATHSVKYGSDELPPRGTGNPGTEISKNRPPEMRVVRQNVNYYSDQKDKWTECFDDTVNPYITHTFVDEVKFDSTGETYTSDKFYCAPYRKAMIYIEHTVTSSPTYYYIDVEFSPDGATWHKFMEGAFGDLRYEDSAGDKKECLSLPVIARYVRIKITSSGCSSSAYFIVRIQMAFQS